MKARKPNFFVLAVLIVTGIGLIFLVSPVNATLIDCVFEGNAVYAFDNSGTIDFNVVKSYSGFLVYDTSVPNSGIDPAWGVYNGAIKEFNVTLGSSNFSLSSSGFNDIKVINRDPGGFGYDIMEFRADLIGPSAIGTIYAELLLSDQDKLVFTNIALPVALHLSDFNSPVRLVLGNSDSDFFVNGTPLTKFEAPAGPGAVPEPSTLLLLGSGLVGLIGIRKSLTKIKL